MTYLPRCTCHGAQSVHNHAPAGADEAERRPSGGHLQERRQRTLQAEQELLMTADMTTHHFAVAEHGTQALQRAECGPAFVDASPATACGVRHTKRNAAAPIWFCVMAATIGLMHRELCRFQQSLNAINPAVAMTSSAPLCPLDLRDTASDRPAS